MPKCPTGAHEATFTLSTEGAPDGVRLVVCSVCNTAIGAVPIPQTEIAKKKVNQAATEMVEGIQQLFSGPKK
ncbi:MAG TPA: hypothetical protein VGQ83_41850 [Polyangia bacterium]|jgi:thiamine biosynthesis protein ThiC